MFRKINKDKSISKIVMYSIILTWFVVILIVNWQYMRLSWFKEVWEFIDFNAIDYYVEDHISMWIFGSLFIIVPLRFIYMSIKAKKPDKHTGTLEPPSSVFRKPNSFEECQDEWEEQRAASVRTNPSYNYQPWNVSYRPGFEKREKH